MAVKLRAIEALAARHARERDETLTGEAGAERRRVHGIVHTPPEVARAVASMSDRLLRERLGLTLGACDPSLLAIDPACGPGAFFAALLALAEQRPGGCVHAVGFDVDATALAAAQLLASHPAARSFRLRQVDALASDALVRCTREHAGPLLLIGNPPWVSARSQLSAVDRARLVAFRTDEHGERLPERKLGVLADAYVRFFALCAEAARTHVSGVVVGLVTNASYLDGLLHRGMRARLASWFDELHVLDLGGSALLGSRRERRDDNVFGVRPGVAITWLCRYPASTASASPRSSAAGHCRYARLFGSRTDKLRQLAELDPHALAFQPLAPESTHAWFTPRPARDPSYERHPTLADWLPFHREGVQSNRDAVVIDDDPQRLLARLRAFVRGDTLPELAQAQRALHHYDPARARKAVAEALERDPDGQGGILLQRMAYRPFDERVFCPIVPLCHRPRPELSRAYSHAPAALLSVRKDRGDLPWTHSAWSAHIADNCFLSARSSCRTRAFPLRTPDGLDNLAPAWADALAERIGEQADVEAFAHYALCIMSAEPYRARWDAELHYGYPRIPMPRSAQAFRTLTAVGQRLASLFAALCEYGQPVSEPAAERYHRDLTLNLDDGAVRLESAVLIQVEPAALRLRVGHHRPLGAYIAARSQRPLDRPTLRQICARAQRLQQLLDVIREASTALQQSGDLFA